MPSTEMYTINPVKDPREVTILPYLMMSVFCASSKMLSAERDSHPYEWPQRGHYTSLHDVVWCLCLFYDGLHWEGLCHPCEWPKRGHFSYLGIYVFCSSSMMASTERDSIISVNICLVWFLWLDKWCLPPSTTLWLLWPAERSLYFALPKNVWFLCLFFDVIHWKGVYYTCEGPQRGHYTSSPEDLWLLCLFYDGLYWKGLCNFCHYLFSLISVPWQMMPSTFYHFVTPMARKVPILGLT